MRVATAVVFAAISPTCMAFLSPGAPRVQITNVVRRPSKLSNQHQYHHERAPRAPRWPKSRIVKPVAENRSTGAATAAADSTDDGGGVAGAVRREVNRIREARLTAGQIKTELDALGVSYTGLLEKSEFVQALAEARVASPGQVSDQALAAEDAEGDEATISLDQELEQEPRPEGQGEEGESSTGASDSSGDAKSSSPEPERASDTKEEATPETEPEPKREPVTESFTQSESVEERIPELESAPEQPSPGPVPEVDSVTEPPSASEPVSGEPVTEPVPAEESPVSHEAFTSPPEVGNGGSQSYNFVDPGSVGSGEGDDIKEEISRIKEVRMNAGQIKAELDSMGVSYVGLLEKAEFVKKLAEARTNRVATGAGDGGESTAGESDVAPGEEAADAAAAEEVTAQESENAGYASGEGMRESELAADEDEDADLPPPPSQPMGEETSGVPKGTDGDGEFEVANDEGKARSAIDREEVLAMRISQIKRELDERGVEYRGLLEKSEFVDLLIDARERGITAAPTASAGAGGGNAEPTGSGEDDASGTEKRTNGFDPSYKDVEIKKMKQDTDGRQGAGGGGAGRPGGMPGSMPGGAGFDIGSILGAMGGGGGGTGAPGGAGGVDIGSILGAMGGMGGPPSGGGPSSGGAASGMGDMLGKLMNNPKAQAVFQKAQSNPKVMAAIQDVSQNGLGAMAKYSDDPEIRDVIEDLKTLF